MFHFFGVHISLWMTRWDTPCFFLISPRTAVWHSTCLRRVELDFKLGRFSLQLGFASHDMMSSDVYCVYNCIFIYNFWPMCACAKIIKYLFIYFGCTIKCRYMHTHISVYILCMSDVNVLYMYILFIDVWLPIVALATQRAALLSICHHSSGQPWHILESSFSG